MHGPFIWRKLIGNKGVVVGTPEPPDPCLCENPNLSVTCDAAGVTYTYQVCYDTYRNCTVGPAGTICERVSRCLTISGSYECDIDDGDCPCPLPCVPGFECYEEPPLRLGCPREELIEQGLFCSRTFIPTSTTDYPVNWIRNPAMGVQSDDGLPIMVPGEDVDKPYYYLPAGDTEIKSNLLCLNYSSASLDYRRLQLISGRNRDLYGGPSCAIYRKGYNPNSGLDTYSWEGIAYGLTHIGYEQSSITRGSAAGQSIFGGTFPMEDGVLRLPLFGGNERGSHSDPTCPDSPCCEDNLPPGQACFTCGERYNPGGGDPDCGGGYGHFLPKDRGSTAGYFSFACFNPQSYLFNSRVISGSARNRIEFPTCSVWAYIKGIRNYIYNVERQYESSINSCDNKSVQCQCGETAADINWSNGTNDGESWWINTDPGGTNAAGISNVRLVMDNLQDRVEKIRVYDPNLDTCNKLGDYQLVTPNVFLWDKDAFLGATAANRWKHLYIIGYSNILWDSGCTNTPGAADPDDPLGLPTVSVRNEILMIDNVSHQVGIGISGASGASRLIGWLGCDGNPAAGTYAEHIRSLRCDGRDWSEPLPSPNQISEFDCTTCLSDRDEMKSCNDPFWLGYGDSVTACDSYPDHVWPCGAFTGDAASSNDANGFIYLKGDGNWAIYPPNPDNTSPAPSLDPTRCSQWYPSWANGCVQYGSANGNAPVQGTVMKLARHTGNGSSYRSSAVVIRTDNKLQQWGGNLGNLSVGATGTYLDGITWYSGIPAILSYPSQSIDVKEVSTSGFHSLAIKTNGDLYSWGLTTGSWNSTPQKVVTNTPAPSSGNFIQIDTGYSLRSFVAPPGSCSGETYYFVSGAVKDNGTLVTWGDNHAAQVESGSSPPSNPWDFRSYVCESSFAYFDSGNFISRPTDAEFVQEGGCTAVFFGTNGAGAITNSPDPETGQYQYKVKVWGLNPSGAGASYQSIPTKGIENIKQLVILDPECCVALKHDGTLVGWGTVTVGSLTIGWNKMVDQGIESENGVQDIYPFRFRNGGSNDSYGNAVLVRRSNGTFGAYWVYPDYFKAYPSPCDIISSC